MKKLLLLSLSIAYALALNVGVSILPQEQIVKKLLPSANVITLMPAGADPHTYEPKPAQMLELSKASVFLGIGVEVEEVWLKRLVENTNIKVVNIDKNIKKHSYSHVELDEHNDHHHKKEHKHDEHHKHHHDHEKEHSHEKHHDHHHHDHNDDVYNGKFDDKDVKNRELKDWYGDWSSIYPYALDGTLDEFFEAKAKNDDKKTKEEYKKYYLDGYKTDVESIKISKDGFEFIQNGVSKKSKYEYKGYKILTYKSGKKGVRYLFEATENNGTPKYVQFSDHNIAPTKNLGHFHIFFGNESQEKLLEEMTNWPTYYPKNMTKADILDDLIHHIKGHHHDKNHHHDGHHDHHHHDHSGIDVHIWTDPIIIKELAKNTADELIKIAPNNKAEIEKNLENLNNSLDKLNLKIYDLTKDLKVKGFISSHPSWGYFAKRYNLKEFTLEFEGKEAKPSELAKIIHIAKDKKACVILRAPQFSDKLVNTLHNESGLKVELVNPLAVDFLEEILKFAKILNDNCSK